MTQTALIILADNKFKNLKLKGGWNAPSQSEENILAQQAGIHNPKERTRRRDHKRNEYKTKKTQGEDSRDNPTWLKKNFKPDYSESKIRTWNDTAWNWCSKYTGGKCLISCRLHKPSKYIVTYTKNPARGDEGISRHK